MADDDRRPPPPVPDPLGGYRPPPDGRRPPPPVAGRPGGSVLSPDDRELDLGPDWSQRWANPSVIGLLWWSAVPYIQAVALGFVSVLEPDGFDRCTAAPTPGEARVQAVIAVVAVLASTLVALWRFRRLQLLAALVPIAFSCVFWLWLLGDNQSCGVPVEVAPRVPLDLLSSSALTPR